jgi:hypothetical protein
MKASIIVISVVIGLMRCGAQTPAPPTLPVSVLSQGPSDSDTDLLVFCLFRSSPRNQLAGSLVETDEKLHGLLTEIRNPGLFNGELGETVVLMPPPGSMKPRKVLIIGLGDSQTFTPSRMYLVGKIAFLEADRLGVAHPFFAASILDGGVTKFTTGEVATYVVGGFRDALALEQTSHARGDAAPPAVADFTYLAGPKNVSSTREGIAKAMSKATAP